jgi:hypothetical protein
MLTYYMVDMCWSYVIYCAHLRMEAEVGEPLGNRPVLQ